MTKPRSIISPLLSLGLLLFVCLSSTSLHAQQPTTTDDERARGIDLYKQGRDQEAITALREALKRNKADISAWHYLGLAYNRQGKAGDAQKAHETAAKASVALLMKLLEIAGDQNVSERLAPLGSQFDEAAKSADKYLELSPKLSASRRHEWSERAAYLREMSRYYSLDESVKDKVYSQTEVSAKARILSRPEPFYTERARENRTKGRVILKVILGVDGVARVDKIVKALPDGLTIQAIRAAHRTKFVPALKDGQPVSQLVQIEYGFNIY